MKTDLSFSSVNVRQSIATNPELSIWVSASAGSGKTYVLSRRVIRLLLQGNKPSELLCLTFTKAAAAEMANRVFEILGQWVMLADDKLAAAIEELTGQEATARELTRARKLFALALDTPGGLRIQTIHAFCESLLHQFPLEANIPGHFVIMDSLEQHELIGEARRQTILTSLGLTDHANSEILADAYSTVRQYASDLKIEQAINQLINQRDEFEEWVRLGGGNAKLTFKSVWEHFDLSAETTVDNLFHRYSTQSRYDEDSRDELIRLASEKSTSSYTKLIEQLYAISQCTDPEKQHGMRCEVFLKKDLNPRASLVNKAFLKNEPAQEALFHEEQNLLIEQLNRLKILNALHGSEALFVIAETILLEYARLKQRRGLLDFGDLISKAANLLNRSEISSWIQYKLDHGISHVLVDEAQDTSPLQWQIIEAITSEFFHGKSATEKVRTVFVVGDEKQSIYSFQGAEPQEFDRQFRKLRGNAINARLKFEQVPLNVSFRSTEEVLSAVDQVFSLPENAKGLGLKGNSETHTAHRISDRGEVIIWPLEYKPEKIEKSDWRAPPGDLTEADAETRLAEKIASTISGWINNNEILPGRSKPIRHGDILILVRKRDRFVSAMNRALKRKNLISAGADRLKLTAHIAIEDMLAIGRFACMEMDDLALAGILKSPLFNFSEDELFDVCNNRGKIGLFRHLCNLAGEDPTMSGISGKVQVATKILKLIRRDASELPVYDFYARLFAKTGLRKKYIGRLGHEVEEVLDGFFQAAINYDDHHGLGLQGFVEVLASSNPELKREIDMAADEIRVITAHSSKGLEAPIVFLVDPGSKAFETRHAPEIIQFPLSDTQSAYLWEPTSGQRIEETSAVYQDIEAAGEEEYRRLLYVGMTRAADRLIVCGYRKKDPPNHTHWYQMIEDGLNAPLANENLGGRLVPVLDKNGDEDGKQWIINNRYYKAKDPQNVDHVKQSDEHESTSWLKPVSPEPAPPRPLSPSGVLGLLDISTEEPQVFAEYNDLAIERGNAVHHLLQILPDVYPEQRNAVMGKYFDTSQTPFSKQVRSEIETMIANLFDKPEFNFLFGSGSKAEVEISGKLKIANRDHLIRGKIDRLVVSAKEIIIVDYKTNRQIPNTARQISSEYLAQLSLYRELIQNLYPEKPVRCMLLWTANTSLMPVDSVLLDEQMARIKNNPQQDVTEGFLT